MTRTIHTIYENGVFRPTERVDLPDRCEVEVQICQVEGLHDRSGPEGPPPRDSDRADAKGKAPDGRELPVADFLVPLQYAWTEASYEARKALKQFSEDAHAND